MPTFEADPSVIRSEANIQAQLNKVDEFKLLPLKITGNTRGLVNPFRGITANDFKKHDLLSGFSGRLST